MVVSDLWGGASLTPVQQQGYHPAPNCYQPTQTTTGQAEHRPCSQLAGGGLLPRDHFRCRRQSATAPGPTPAQLRSGTPSLSLRLPVAARSRSRALLNRHCLRREHRPRWMFAILAVVQTLGHVHARHHRL
jgi:hypothetical protein